MEAETLKEERIETLPELSTSSSAMNPELTMSPDSISTATPDLVDDVSVIATGAITDDGNYDWTGVLLSDDVFEDGSILCASKQIGSDPLAISSEDDYLVVLKESISYNQDKDVAMVNSKIDCLLVGHGGEPVSGQVRTDTPPPLLEDDISVGFSVSTQIPRYGVAKEEIDPTGAEIYRILFGVLKSNTSMCDELIHSKIQRYYGEPEEWKLIEKSFYDILPDDLLDGTKVPREAMVPIATTEFDKPVTPRGPQTCKKCGQPRKGHICSKPKAAKAGRCYKQSCKSTKKTETHRPGKL